MRTVRIPAVGIIAGISATIAGLEEEGMAIGDVVGEGAFDRDSIMSAMEDTPIDGMATVQEGIAGEAARSTFRGIVGRRTEAMRAEGDSISIGEVAGMAEDNGISAGVINRKTLGVGNRWN